MASKANGPLKVTYNIKDVLGKGKYSVDFLGLFDGREVAVRRVLKEYVETASTEDQLLQFKHPNVQKLWKIEDIDEFRLYAFDLVIGNLDDLCQGKYSGLIPDDGQAMLQMAKGLEYIHSKKIIHGNLRPQSIRISKDVPTRLMIGSISTFQVKENDGWIAPELVKCHQIRADDDNIDEDSCVEEVHTASNNVWTLGCLFFYLLTRGKHPFGNHSSEINWNLSVTRKPIELESKLRSQIQLSGGIVQYVEVIKSMIKMESSERQGLYQVILYLEEVQRHMAMTPEASPHHQNDLPSSKKFVEIWRQHNRGVSQGRYETIYAQGGGDFFGRQINLEAQVGGFVQHRDGSSSNRRDGPRNVAQCGGEVPQHAGGSSSDRRDGHTNTISVLQPAAQLFGGQQSSHRYPAPGEFWTDRSSDQREERLQWNDEWLHNKVQELENKLQLTSDELKRTSFELKKKIRESNEKIGHLNETAIRKKVTNYAMKRSQESREIKTLAQLVKCYSEAKGIGSSDEDNSKMCQKLVSYLKEKKSENNFCQWYYQEAMKRVGNKSIKDLIAKHQCWNKEGNFNYAVTAEYKKSTFLRNYINGPMTEDDWNNFSGTSSSIVLLTLFESLEGRTDLMSFPPPGTLTMDVPVKISSAKNSVHIEIGEIKSSDFKEVINKARKQLKINLLCFQWLDKIIEKLQVECYGLIGNIYIDGNRQSNTENLEDYEDEFTFKQKYETYT